MDDRLRESLSAMLDDEADELAVRRVLAQGDNQRVQAQWLRWHRLREEIRGQDQRWADIDVRSGIWAALDEAAPESTPQPPPLSSQASPSILQSRGTAALAAMLVFALMMGFGAGQHWSSIEAEATLAGTSGTDVPSVPLQNLDEQQWEQLSDYLLRHAQHNSVAAGQGAVGFARVASVSPGTP